MHDKLRMSNPNQEGHEDGRQREKSDKTLMRRKWKNIKLKKNDGDEWMKTIN